MSTASALAAAFRAGKLDTELRPVYRHDLDGERPRFGKLADTFDRHFAADRLLVFSTPGRTELGGNHTDHNAGRVLAASVDLDTVAVVGPRTDDHVRIRSEGFEELIEVSLSQLAPRADEAGTPAALVRGVAAYLRNNGRTAGGFDAAVSSRVDAGSGLSSSASFEVLIATVFSFLYNGGELSPVELAQAGRFAENTFFGKPSGLMDQIACAAGGVVAIDFEEADQPLVERIKVDFTVHGYQLCAVHTGGSHVDLTSDYASVVEEMGAVAEALGVRYLRELSYEDFRAQLGRLQERVSDRALLRAFHFFWENDRVVRQSRMLKDGDIEGFLAEVRESGSSSWRLLQNCYSDHSPEQQGIPIALTLTEEFLSRPDIFPHPPRWEGAARVHGGGFAGTVQAYVPVSRVAEYKRVMGEVLGGGAVTELPIRDTGACLIADTRAAGATD